MSALYLSLKCWRPLSWGDKLQSGGHSQSLKWFQPVCFLKRALCQLASSLRAEPTLASSCSARGRASGSDASMSNSRAHMAGRGGGGSGGALLHFIGMHSWRSALSHKASPSGINQPERLLHTYAPDGRDASKEKGWVTAQKDHCYRGRIPVMETKLVPADKAHVTQTRQAFVTHVVDELH